MDLELYRGLLTDDQRLIFDSFPDKKKKYAVLRGSGYSKRDAYTMSGYGGSIKTASQSGYLLESRTVGMREIIARLSGIGSKAKELESAHAVMQEGSEESQIVDEKAKGDNCEEEVFLTQPDTLKDKLVNASVEDAKRVQFYRRISNGTLCDKKTTRTYAPDGKLLKTTIEEKQDVSSMMQARRELDRILGLTEILQLGNVKAGQITINIVDASRKEEMPEPIILNSDEVVEEVVEEKGASENGE